MRFWPIALTGFFIVAPAAVSAQAVAAPFAHQAAQGTPHDELHSRMEREHQQWHFARDRGPRDDNWNREHDKLHQRLEQKHEQWHRQNAASQDRARDRNQDRGNDSGKKGRKRS